MQVLGDACSYRRRRLPDVLQNCLCRWAPPRRRCWPSWASSPSPTAWSSARCLFRPSVSNTLEYTVLFKPRSQRPSYLAQCIDPALCGLGSTVAGCGVKLGSLHLFIHCQAATSVRPGLHADSGKRADWVSPLAARRRCSSRARCTRRRCWTSRRTTCWPGPSPPSPTSLPCRSPPATPPRRALELWHVFMTAHPAPHIPPVGPRPIPLPSAPAAVCRCLKACSASGLPPAQPMLAVLGRMHHTARSSTAHLGWCLIANLIADRVLCAAGGGAAPGHQRLQERAGHRAGHRVLLPPGRQGAQACSTTNLGSREFDFQWQCYGE